MAAWPAARPPSPRTAPIPPGPMRQEVHYGVTVSVTCRHPLRRSSVAPFHKSGISSGRCRSAVDMRRALGACAPGAQLLDPCTWASAGSGDLGAAADGLLVDGATLVVAEARFVVCEEHFGDEIAPTANAGLVEDTLEVLL